VKQVIDLDSKSAVTIFSSVKIPRDNPKEELGIVDLENYISQAIWKLFDVSRGKASERLKVNEVDLLLTDARVMQIKIDGHQIINPHGFTGKELEVMLGITMVKRNSFYDDLQPLEGGAVRSYLLTKKLGIKEAIYIELGNKWTTLFAIKPSETAYLSEFEWGYDNIIFAIQEHLDISDYAARNIYPRFAKKLVSPHVGNRFEKIFDKVFMEFVSGLTLKIKNIQAQGPYKLPPIYIKSFFPIPDSVHHKKLSICGKQIRLLPCSEDVDIRLFVEDEIHELYKELNELAQRRIKWLMPTG
jgi:hypothetical protein